ncbi:DNA cytosine methyltransferase [Roseomonas elaeocarpi]|uniref:DNA (cytosine-5-)-methyltransferase n=1 Tax=Roseomonas elaeocarpi TaxID=907779 RepID=A0ABV6JQR1_9PROT
MPDGSNFIRAAGRKRAPAQWPLDAGITVVLFAGLGGACDGLEEAGFPVSVANNHDDVALAAHAARHPHTVHVRGDIFDVDPLRATGGRRVKVLWASPDCRDHSVAKGGAPRSPRVRSLPWQVCRWAGVTQPEVIYVENVREIRGWGPLVAKRDAATGRVLKADGTVAAPGERVPVREQQLVRDRRQLGRSFRAWVQHLRGLGYAYEDRDLCCADFGVPTTRRRFFAVARRDGLPIRWPVPTHAPRAQAKAAGLKPWVPAAAIIDWSIPCPSIFDRARPLAPATMRRIAAGMKRYVLDSPEPFLIPVTHSGQLRSHLVGQPLPTITTAKGGEFAVVAPTLIQMGYGEREGQAPRVLDIHEPIGTQVGANKFALVAAWMVQHNLGVVGHDMAEPVSTMTTAGSQQQLGVAYLAHLRGTSTARDATDPVPTLTSGGEHVAAVVAFLQQYYSEGTTSQGCAEPLATVTTKARFGVVTVTLAGQPYAIVDIGMRMLTPEEAARAHELRLPGSITLDGRQRPLTKTEAMRLIGNSVPKRMARLLAEVNASHALAPALRRTAA